MFKRFVVFLVVSSVLVSASLNASSSKGQDSKMSREKRRRVKLYNYWREGKLQYDKYIESVYKPTVVGCKESISDSKRKVSKYRNKLSSVKTQASKKKYSKAIELYNEYIELLSGALKLVEEEKKYNKLCSDSFPAIKEQEKKMARVLGVRVSRDWLMTTELYPSNGSDKKSQGTKKSDKKSEKVLKK